MITKRCRRALATVISLMLLLAACGRNGGDPAPALVGLPAKISHIHGLGIDASGALFAATHYGLLRYDPAGMWTHASKDRNDHMGFTIDPRSGTMYRSGHSMERPSLGVESSKDGADWTRLSDVAQPPVDFHAMALSYADGSTLWGWDSGGRGLFRSADGGRNWKTAGAQGLDRRVYSLAGSARADVVYAGTAGGLHRSADAGATWQPVPGMSGGWAIAVATFPANGDMLLAFTESGLKSTDDGGATWRSVGEGLPADAQITSLVASIDGMQAYAADSSSVFRSIDRGATWTALRNDDERTE